MFLLGSILLFLYVKYFFKGRSFSSAQTSQELTSSEGESTQLKYSHIYPIVISTVLEPKPYACRSLAPIPSLAPAATLAPAIVLVSESHAGQELRRRPKFFSPSASMNSTVILCEIPAAGFHAKFVWINPTPSGSGRFRPTLRFSQRLAVNCQFFSQCGGME